MSSIKQDFVKFDQVDKSYDGKVLVVKGLDLDIAEGEFLTLLGPSGSGKSTLLSLMIRLFDHQEGEIFINKQKIKDLQLKNLRSKFSLVTQDTVLFDGSIYEYILSLCSLLITGPISDFGSVQGATFRDWAFSETFCTKLSAISPTAIATETAMHLSPAEPYAAPIIPSTA